MSTPSLSKQKQNLKKKNRGIVLVVMALPLNVLTGGEPKLLHCLLCEVDIGSKW
jgi:hypothetical protein